MAFNLEKRQIFSEVVKQGYKVDDIAFQIGMTSMSVRNELKKGLSQSDYIDRRYIQYDIGKAIEQEIISKIGDDGYEFFKDWLAKQEKKKR